MTGGTKVTVRADGIEDLVDIFPDPKCRFGGNAQIVDANYVSAPRGQLLSTNLRNLR